MADGKLPDPEALVAILLDRTAPDGDRGDAAMDLGSYDEPIVVAALEAVVVDPAEEEHVLDDAGLSIAEIWSRHGRMKEGVFRAMQPAARRVAEEFLRAKAPELLADLDDAEAR